MRISLSHQPEQAFLSAFDEYADEVFQYCFLHSYDRQRALELMQETFEKTWDYIASGHDVENAESFLLAVASTCCTCSGSPTFQSDEEEMFSAEDVASGVYVMKIS